MKNIKKSRDFNKKTFKKLFSKANIQQKKNKVKRKKQKNKIYNTNNVIFFIM
jgi:hypothetical protein